MYPFIASDLININENNEPNYNFVASKFIFDLDETERAAAIATRKEEAKLRRKKKKNTIECV